MGAQWNEAQKDKVFVIIAVLNIATEITGAELNIDGEKIRLTTAATTTDMDAGGTIVKESARAFLTDLSTVEKVVKSKRAWLRVLTPTGSIENSVIDGSTDRKAYQALIRFMSAVKAQ